MINKHAAALAICGAAISTFISTSNVKAGSYQALCSGTKCTINITPKEISSPFGSIPLTRISNWNGGGDTSKIYGKSIATSVVFGPFDLLGLVPKRHDYNFVVNGYDASGISTSIQIQFLNDSPAKQFIAEMASLTNLGMGQHRSATEIKLLESRQISLSRSHLGANQQQIHTLDEAAKIEQSQRFQGLNQAATSSPQACKQINPEAYRNSKDLINTSTFDQGSSQVFPEGLNANQSHKFLVKSAQ